MCTSTCGGPNDASHEWDMNVEMVVAMMVFLPPVFRVNLAYEVHMRNIRKIRVVGRIMLLTLEYECGNGLGYGSYFFCHLSLG